MKKSTGNIFFPLGLILIIVQAFILDNMLQKGTLVIPQYVNFATLLYDLVHWLGLCLIGIVGLVMTIIGIIYMNKSDKK